MYTSTSSRWPDNTVYPKILLMGAVDMPCLKKITWAQLITNPYQSWRCVNEYNLQPTNILTLWFCASNPHLIPPDHPRTEHHKNQKIPFRSTIHRNNWIVSLCHMCHGRKKFLTSETFAFVCDLFLGVEWQMCVFFVEFGPISLQHVSTVWGRATVMGQQLCLVLWIPSGVMLQPHMAPCLSIWIIYISTIFGSFWRVNVGKYALIKLAVHWGESIHWCFRGAPWILSWKSMAFVVRNPHRCWLNIPI